jgi:hypothetical protein
MRQSGLDRSTLVVAGVATLGLIMAVLDTTIVNVALDTLSSDLHAPLGTIEWVIDGVPAVPRGGDPAVGLRDRALRGPSEHGSPRSCCSRSARRCARWRRRRAS